MYKVNAYVEYFSPFSRYKEFGKIIKVNPYGDKVNSTHYRIQLGEENKFGVTILFDSIIREVSKEQMIAELI